MSNSLEERLKTHSTAFDGLLSLIPAKYYYDEATQDQWQQQKKSKEELKQNKRQKLDPSVRSDQNMSAKEVMKVRAEEAKPVVLPQPIVRPVEEEEEEEEEVEQDEEVEDEEVEEKQDDEQQQQEQQQQEEEEEKLIDNSDDEHIQLEFDDEGNEINQETEIIQANQNQNEIKKVEAETKKPKKQLSEEDKKKKAENLKKLREKLASKINNLKERRKAPGTKTGGSVKSREQILAERKKKAELKQKEKLKRKQEEIESNSDSESDQEDNDDDNEDQNVLFGNITFKDGTRVTSDLSKLRTSTDKKKSKGPANNDIKAHLLKLEKKKAQIANLAPEDQAKQIEKDKWSRLMNQAEGIKVKDDEKLLKKSLKRKEKQKLKSEIEWKERKQMVKETIAAKIKKRDENLRLRKENKGKPKKNQVRLKKFTGIATKKDTKNKKKRAGFEGSAKSKKK